MIARFDPATKLPMGIFFVVVATAALLVSLLFYRLVERPLLATLRDRLLSPRPQRNLCRDSEAVV